MCYSITSMEIFLILGYQHITTQIKQYITHKHDILQTQDCKGGHLKMTIIKTDFTFAAQLVYPIQLL